MNNVSGLMLVNFLMHKGWEFNIFEAQPNSELNQFCEYPLLCLTIAILNRSYTVHLDNDLEVLELFNRILLEFPEQ